MKNKSQPEYSKLAEIYDEVMDDVAYDIWADFIDDIIQVHHPNPNTILELACGTGSLALNLDELGYYDILATDKSPHMIKQASKKGTEHGSGVRFEVMDFLDIHLDQAFDIVVSIFDSINYLHRSRDIHHLLGEVKKVITPESLFIFDFTTPRNSIQAIEFLNNEEGYTSDNYRFLRKSRYDGKKQIHYNSFQIEKLDTDGETVLERYSEEHEQRIYSLQQMLDIIGETDYNIVAKYEDFDLVEADSKSLRITMVLQCHDIQ